MCTIDKPGHCNGERYLNVVDKKLFNQIISFIDKNNIGPNADISPKNACMNYISNHFNIKVDQITRDDYNFCKLPKNRYGTIFCFLVLEHLQNPLFFMRLLKNMLKDEGTIYLSMPSRPKILWNSHHYFEIPRKHFEKWILKPLGLKIVRYKRIRSSKKWYFHFTGIRPFLRSFCDFQIIYKIVKA